MIIKASNIFLSPKNTGDQAKFSPNWIKKKVNGKRFSCVIPPLKKIKNEAAIIMYKTIHTGVNIHSGGFKKGLFKLSYQVIFCIFIV